MPPRIDNERCNGCGVCVALCSEDVFFGTPGFGRIKTEKAVVSNPEVCWHCNWCVEKCPTQAIRLIIPLSMHIPYKRVPG